jgi:hypothetical protein
MRGFLINKNLCFYYWLRKRIGKKWADKVAITTENGILIFGRSKGKYYSPREEQGTLKTIRR